jgi:hypothetical protein
MHPINKDHFLHVAMHANEEKCQLATSLRLEPGCFVMGITQMQLCGALSNVSPIDQVTLLQVQRVRNKLLTFRPNKSIAESLRQAFKRWPEFSTAHSEGHFNFTIPLGYTLELDGIHANILGFTKTLLHGPGVFRAEQARKEVYGGKTSRSRKVYICHQINRAFSAPLRYYHSVEQLCAAYHALGCPLLPDGNLIENTLGTVSLSLKQRLKNLPQFSTIIVTCRQAEREVFGDQKLAALRQIPVNFQSAQFKIPHYLKCSPLQELNSLEFSLLTDTPGIGPYLAGILTFTLHLKTHGLS